MAFIEWLMRDRERFRKDGPLASDVHVSNTGGKPKKKKPKSFKDALAEDNGHLPVTNMTLAAQQITGQAKPAQKADWSIPVTIAKVDDEQQLVFGWASIVHKDGAAVEDLQGDIIEVVDLEGAVYEYVLDKREAGEMHRTTTGIGKLVESMMMTVEKQAALGIAEGSTPLGWWVGYKIESPEVWQKIRQNEYSMFSIGGRGVREKIEA